MKKVILYLLVFIIPIFNNCSKEAEIGEKDYPFILTGEITDITGTSVVFNGEIISTGKDEIIEYGFLWDKTEPRIETANKAVVSNPAATGSFSLSINYNLIKDSVQIVRSYIKTNNLVVYGNQQRFTCNGGMPAEIYDFSPRKGYVNSTVVITGNYFTNRKEKVSVFFGDKKAVIDSCSNERLVVRVPDVDVDMEVSITVSVYNKATASDNKFRAFTYWKRISDFPGKVRYSTSSFSIDNMGYVGLGANSDGGYYRDFYRYNPQNDSWSRIADFPGAACAYAIGFSYNGKGYVGFGYSYQEYYRDLWAYDPTTDQWSKVAMNENIWTYEDACFVIENELFVVAQSGVHKLNLDNMEFTNLGYFTGNYRFFTTGFSLNGKGYMFAGQEPGNRYLKDLWEYNRNENSWEKISELKGSKYRDSPISFTLGNRMFMGMGGFSTAYNDIFEYEITNNAWYELERLPGKGRKHAASFTVNNKAYVGTGRSGYYDELTDFYEFDPFKE